MVAFYVGQTANIYFFSLLRRHYPTLPFTVRKLLSDIVSHFIDTCIFIPFAFYDSGVELTSLATGHYIIKVVLTLAYLPIAHLGLIATRWHLRDELPD